MVIIEKKLSHTNTIYYEFTETATLAVRRWYPEYELPRPLLIKVLEAMCKSFESDILTGRNATVITDVRKNGLTSYRPVADPKDMTLYQFCEAIFLPRKTIKISENTRDRWTGMLNRRVYPALGDYRIADITAPILSDFLWELQYIGLACNTVTGHYVLLKSIFTMAMSRGTISFNPMDKVEKPTPRKDEPAKLGTPSRYSPQTMAYIEECAKKESLKWQTYIYIMSDTGLRRGECCGILWKNVNFKAKQITIDGSLYYTPAKGTYRDTTKNRKVRTVDISDHTLQLLCEMWLLNEAGLNSEYVFTRNNSPLPMNPVSATRYFANFGKRYGIENMHPHKLRHTFASIAISAGADVASVATILGHSNYAVTLNVYTETDRTVMRQTQNTYRKAVDSAKAV